MHKQAFAVLFVSAVALACAGPALAKSSEQTGKLKIHVSPKQAYVFVDGNAIRDGSQSLKLPAGDHELGVYNYGYQPKTQKVHIEAGKTADVSMALQASGDKVSGPFAEIEFKGNPRAAVLLNGQTPAYFVGHVDEFDWDWIWHQRLLVKPGSYQVTVTREGNKLWSGQVTTRAGQRVTVDLNHNGALKTQAWKQGTTMGPQPRFRVGIASATIPIAPVSAQLSAQTGNLTCGQSTALNWNSTDAIDTSISGLGSVAAKGDRTVSPTHNMTYTLTAKGPGGVATQTVTVDVNTEPTATLALSQPEVRYHKVGDKVEEQGSTTLNWSASNANSAAVSPFGSVGLSGDRTITASPQQTHRGPINENVTYTLTASNTCGGTITKTTTLHLVGSIDPPPPINLASIFYPTAYPTHRHPQVGLVSSEKQTLAELANHFKSYEQYDHKAQLMIVAHADVRGSKRYNQSLSERRAEVIRNYLLSQGIPSDKIETRAVGKTQQLDEKTVEVLQSKDPQKPAKWERRSKHTTWLAYNRRADVLLEPEGQQSTEAYPNDVAETRILWERHAPSLRAVNLASKGPAGTEQARAGGSGN